MKLVRCYFTLEELHFINKTLERERHLSFFVNEHLKNLWPLDVKLPTIPQPNVLGKLLSYIKKGEQGKFDIEQF